MPLGAVVGLSPGDFILDGESLGTQPPLTKRLRSPQFSAHVCCGQTAAWIKILLGTEIGLGPDDIVLDGDPAPLPKRGAPQFSAYVYCAQTAGWIKMALGVEVDRRPGHNVLDGDPAPSPKKGAQTPNFRHMSIVAKRLDRS